MISEIATKYLSKYIWKSLH